MAANQTFTTLRTAAAGEVLRGVSLAPSSNAIVAPVSKPLVLSAANYGSTALAPGSLATATGVALATTVAGATTTPWPATFGGATVTIIDAAGKSWPAPLLYVAPDQVNFQVPSGVAAGTSSVTVTNGNSVPQTSNVTIAPVAPGVFTLTNASLAAGYAVKVAADGTQTVLNVYSANNGATVPNPVSLGSATDRTYLVLFGTGFAAAGTSGVKVTVNSECSGSVRRSAGRIHARPGPGEHSNPSLGRRQGQHQCSVDGERHCRQPGADHRPVSLPRSEVVQATTSAPQVVFPSAIW